MIISDFCVRKCTDIAELRVALKATLFRLGILLFISPATKPQLLRDVFGWAVGELGSGGRFACDPDRGRRTAASDTRWAFPTDQVRYPPNSVFFARCNSASKPSGEARRN